MLVHQFVDRFVFITKKKVSIMFWLCFLCIIVLSSVLLSSQFDLPNNARIILLLTTEDMIDFMSQPFIADSTLVAMISNDFSKDSYFSLYLGHIIDLFQDLSKGTVFVMYQWNDLATIEAGLVKFMDSMPVKSVLISIEHGMALAGMYNIYYSCMHTKKGPSVVYHMNHEKPWLFHNNSYHLNLVFSTLDELQQSYDRFPLVLRNYYYEPLTGHSMYVPVGSPFASYSFYNSSSPWQTAKYSKPASQRSKFCHFKGRAFYNATEGDHPSYQLLPHPEREELLQQQTIHHKLLQCHLQAFEAFPMGTSTQGKTIAIYEAYLSELIETVFALCPGGNNHETFRLYEALDTGAIPIIVRPTNPEQNFLNDEIWSDYPGPVLNNWSELDDYLTIIQAKGSAAIDQLQQTLITWQDNFKLKVKDRVYDAVHDVFRRVEQVSLPLPSSLAQEKQKQSLLQQQPQCNNIDLVASLQQKDELITQQQTQITTLETRLTDFEETLKLSITQTLKLTELFKRKEEEWERRLKKIEHKLFN